MLCRYFPRQNGDSGCYFSDKIWECRSQDTNFNTGRVAQAGGTRQGMSMKHDGLGALGVAFCAVIAE